MFEFRERSLDTQLDFTSRVRGDGSQDSSGVCSPTLWMNTPPNSPPRNGHRSLSPASRAQAISRGQKELMEMVCKIPDSCYELSLKDLVEVNTNLTDRDDQERKSLEQIPAKGNMERKGQVKRNASVNERRVQSIDDRGFLLKMVFPITFGFKKGRKVKRGDSLATSNGSRVSPRPSISDGYTESGEGETRLRKTNSQSTKSIGSNSGSSGSGRQSICRNNDGSGCWFFLWKLPRSCFGR